MAETRPTATVKPTTSVQARKSSNIISLIAPVLCLLTGYVIWRFGLGATSNFEHGTAGGFWPDREGPKSALSKMYLGGIIVPILIGTFLTMITFVIERFMTVAKATGTGATSLELPMLEKNLVFLSTIATIATLIGLLGTVIGMIRAFAGLGADSGGASSAAQLSIGISEALYNTALGIGTSAVAIVFYNIFTTKIDGITYGIDESGFTLTQTFASLYK